MNREYRIQMGLEISLPLDLTPRNVHHHHTRRSEPKTLGTKKAFHPSHVPPPPSGSNAREPNDDALVIEQLETATPAEWRSSAGHAVEIVLLENFPVPYIHDDESAVHTGEIHSPVPYDSVVDNNLGPKADRVQLPREANGVVGVAACSPNIVADQKDVIRVRLMWFSGRDLAVIYLAGEALPRIRGCGVPLTQYGAGVI